MLWTNEKRKKKLGRKRDSNPWPLRQRCSALTNSAMKTHTLGAGQFVEIILNRKQLQINPKEIRKIGQSTASLTQMPWVRMPLKSQHPNSLKKIILRLSWRIRLECFFLYLSLFCFVRLLFLSLFRFALFFLYSHLKFCFFVGRLLALR